MPKDPTPNMHEKPSKDDPPPTAQPPNFHPHHITPDTFHHLLTCYPGTVEALARRKALERATRSSTAKAKKAKKSRSGTPAAAREAQTDQDQVVDREVKEFLELDEGRYRGLPGVVRSRGGEGSGGGFLTKEELVEVMEWKLFVPSPPLVSGVFMVWCGD